MARNPKIGRNDPCPCGSGKKYKRCCLHSGATAPNAPPLSPSSAEVLQRKYLNDESRRRQLFGEVRPFIHADCRGEKWIAVGNEFHHSKDWKTPIDFLNYYLKYRFTPEWGNQEIAKPLSERHPVMQWYDSMCRLQAEQSPKEGGVFGVNPNGAMRTYILLSYDLYTLRHHRSLQQSLINRLKHIDQFQGARHELFAAATCIRAGFTIDFEDETDPSSKHVEFVAIHTITGQKVSVEAKSKHRDGVLGRSGIRTPDDEVRALANRLIKKALDKPAKHPLVIFLDLNLPPSSPVPMTLEWFQKITEPIVQDRQKEDDKDPWNLLLFTNFPDHYADHVGPPPSGYSVGLFGKEPSIVADHPAAIESIFDAALKFGNVPNTFDDLQ